VPGAYTASENLGTSGGALNNEGVMTGHYDPNKGGCNSARAPMGHIAYPKFNMDK